MKRSIIILLVLIVLFAMPVLAEEPEQENAPLVNEDEMFLGEMSQLSEEELSLVIGNANAEGAGIGPLPEDPKHTTGGGYHPFDDGTNPLPPTQTQSGVSGGTYNNPNLPAGGILRSK